MDTKARNGLHRVSFASESQPEQTTYNWPDRAEPVEMEEELNAEHCVELVRDMQLCARIGGTDARNARSSEKGDPGK